MKLNDLIYLPILEAKLGVKKPFLNFYQKVIVTSNQLFFDSYEDLLSQYSCKINNNLGFILHDSGIIIYTTNSENFIKNVPSIFLEQFLKKINEEVSSPVLFITEFINKKLLLEFKVKNKSNAILEEKKKYRNFLKLLSDQKVLIAAAEQEKEIVENIYGLYQKYPTDTTGNLLFTIENVTANDTLGRGPSIFLGNITFAVNFFSKKILVHSGDFQRTAFANNLTFLPHQLENNNVCLGTFELDFHDCFKNFDEDVFILLLTKFASSYVSTDPAGKHYKKWLNTVETVLTIDGTYCNKEDAFYSAYYTSIINKKKAKYMPKYKGYILKEDLIFLEEYQDYFLNSEVILYKNKPQLKSEMILAINEEYYFIEDVTYIEELEEYVPNFLIFTYNKKEYTLGTVPSEYFIEKKLTDFLTTSARDLYSINLLVTHPEEKDVIYRFTSGSHFINIKTGLSKRFRFSDVNTYFY